MSTDTYARPGVGGSYALRMTEPQKQWTVRHFSQANPAGPGCDSVPALLRRPADSIEARSAPSRSRTW